MGRIWVGFDNKMKSVYKREQVPCAEVEGMNEVRLSLGSMRRSGWERGGGFRDLRLCFPDSKGGSGGVC